MTCFSVPGVSVAFVFVILGEAQYFFYGGQFFGDMSRWTKHLYASGKKHCFARKTTPKTFQAKKTNVKISLYDKTLFYLKRT